MKWENLLKVEQDQRVNKRWDLFNKNKDKLNSKLKQSPHW